MTFPIYVRNAWRALECQTVHLTLTQKNVRKETTSKEKRAMDLASRIEDDYIEHLKDLSINLAGKDILTDGEVQMLDTIGEELEWAIAWEKWSVINGKP